MPVILEKRGKETLGWKFLIGEEIAKLLKLEDIDTELRGILERIDNSLYSQMK